MKKPSCALSLVLRPPAPGLTGGVFAWMPTYKTTNCGRAADPDVFAHAEITCVSGHGTRVGGHDRHGELNADECGRPAVTAEV